MTKAYKIFPSIGIARVGNSTSEYFIGPEAPGIVPPGPYRDATGKMKRQGAIFRIYEFEVNEFGEETILREVTDDSNTTINWSVHLVNRKAAAKEFPPLRTSDRNAEYERNGLIIDSGKQTIAGTNQSFGPLEGDISFIKDNRIEASATVKLGDLKKDDSGRLIVLGGHGKSASPLNTTLTNFANNDGWYDDVSDGPVTATICINGDLFTATSAWVVVAAPAYAPAIDNVMTWYDQAVSVRDNFFEPIRLLDRPSFTKDIYPILRRAVYLQWVSETARFGHGTGTRGDFLEPAKLNQLSDNSETAKPQRESVFSRLTRPNTLAPQAQRIASAPENMPKLYSGVDPTSPSNEYLFPSLTEHQFRVMTKWKDGDFDSDWPGSEPAPVPFDQILLAQQPQALSQAALEGCIGGPFYPGIETTYLMALASTYGSPFRINPSHPPGYLTEHMALPWQADFLDCGALWWPAQRPVSVKVGSQFESFSRGIDGFDPNRYARMVRYWSHLGLIVQEGSEYVETERLPIP